MTETYNISTPGLGITLGYCTTSGGSYTTLAQVKSIDGPSFEVGSWEATGLASSSKEFLPTIFSGGEFSATVNYNPSDTTHQSIYTTMVAKTIMYWKVTFPAAIGPGASGETSHYFEFAGFISGFAVSGEEAESFAEAAIKITVTGDVAFT